MGYTEAQFRRAVEQFGEVFFVLDSDREYEIHGNRGYEIANGVVEIEGMKDGEYIDVQFPLSAIEHHYSHREA